MSGEVDVTAKQSSKNSPTALSSKRNFRQARNTLEANTAWCAIASRNHKRAEEANAETASLVVAFTKKIKKREKANETREKEDLPY